MHTLEQGKDIDLRREFFEEYTAQEAVEVLWELMWLIILSSSVACVVAAMVVISVRQGARAEKKLPPGPAALPVIGHMHLMGKSPHRSFCELNRVYGPLMSLRLGSVPIIVASSPDMARQILQTHDKVFASRFRTAACKAIYGSCPSFTFSDSGPYLKFLRQLCATELFSATRMRSFEPLRREEVGALVRSLSADAHNTICVRPKLQAATSNIICRMVLGEAPDNVVPVLLDVIRMLGAFNVGDYIPLLKWMDLGGYERHSKLVVGPKLKAAFQALIDARRKQRCGHYDPPADLLDILLSACDANCPQNIDLNDDHIKAVLQEIFGGGSDTSALLIEWALAELLANPTKMTILKEELESVVGMERTHVEESDLSKVPYLMAVIKETMRLHPIITFLIPRMSTQPCQISGYHIPAHTQAYVNTWAIGRDPEVWKRPLEFLPERFLESSVDVRGLHFELLPFGSGRRGCLGWTLGLLNVQIILANLLHAFDWSVPLEHQLDMSEKLSPLLTKATPLLASIAPTMIFRN